jgi:hypothetical protein
LFGNAIKIMYNKNLNLNFYLKLIFYILKSF